MRRERVPWRWSGGVASTSFRDRDLPKGTATKSRPLLKVSAFQATKLLGRVRGMHGYPPESTPDMDGIFMAIGRGVPAGAAPARVRALDLAPTVSALLGMDPPAGAEGRVVEAITVRAGATP